MQLNKIENLAWVLPRPRKTSKYVGGFPLHFEKKLLKLLDIDPNYHKILQPFGGMGEFGIRIDLRESVKPDVLANAHNLPFKNNIFDLVLLDPPYSQEDCIRLYDKKLPKLIFKKYVAEAVRVTKEKGYVVMFHVVAYPSIPNTILIKRILIEVRIWHKGRIVHIHQKRSDLWKKNESESLF